MGRLGTGGNTVVDFTDGDTFKRVTVTDPRIEYGSLLTTGIHRATIADVDDPGWLFLENVVTVRAGSFDAIVGALMMNDGPGVDEYPNEIITLTYLID